LPWQQGHSRIFESKTKLFIQGKNVIDTESIYALRYQVYCHEAQFLDPNSFPDGLEYDEYDAVSEHFSASNFHGSHLIAGALRLVKWSKSLSFPTAVRFPLLVESLEQQGYPLHATAEISRLCISKKIRQQEIEYVRSSPRCSASLNKRAKIPTIILQLFRSIHFASKYNLGITHWIATFEEGLYRLLTKYGIHFKLLVPEELDYYGKVKIYGASIKHLEKEMQAHMPELYREYFI
jgi:N-acyl amino acid synthase of PEP-CTERM/exosortase system